MVELDRHHCFQVVEEQLVAKMVKKSNLYVGRNRHGLSR